MVTSNINFTDKLIEIINDITNLAPNKDMDIRIAQDEELPYYSLGQCNLDASSGKITILLKEGNTDEVTVSHELLHAYYARLGYSWLVIPNIICDAIVVTATRLDDIIFHKYIYEEQRKRGINIEVSEKKDAQVLLKNLNETGILDEDYMGILNIIEIEYCGNKYRNDYLEHLLKNHKKSYDAAKRIINIYKTNDSSTPFSARRTLIRVFKEFENIVADYGEKKLSLQLLVCIPPIFSKRQLSQITSSVFGFNENSFITQYEEKFSTLHLKSDGQCCCFIDSKYNDEMKKNLEVYMLKRYLQEYKIDYSLRD